MGVSTSKWKGKGCRYNGTRGLFCFVNVKCEREDDCTFERTPSSPNNFQDDIEYTALVSIFRPVDFCVCNDVE